MQTIEKAVKPAQVVPLRQSDVIVVRQGLSVKRAVRGVVVAGAIAYAGYSAYRQKIVTFEEVASGAKTLVAWIARRDINEQEMLKALDVLRKEREHERREREAERRDNKQMAERLKAMSRALDVCMANRPRPTNSDKSSAGPPPQPGETGWPWDVFREAQQQKKQIPPPRRDFFWGSVEKWAGLKLHFA
jgi:hypothetical protein